MLATSPVHGALPYGLKVLEDGKDAIIEYVTCASNAGLQYLLVRFSSSIVAVHELNGHRDKTWTAKNDVNWLQDLLPSDIPNARILSWGYDANTHSSSQISDEYLYNYGTTLITDLVRKRRATSVLPKLYEKFKFMAKKCADREASYYLYRP